MWKLAVVDDDPNVVQGMKTIIPWDELGVEWAGEGRDGKQGLDVIRSTQPDIVLTDIYMPVMNGLEMIEQLRKEGFKGKILILSGYSDFEYARQAVRLHVDDYLSKPLSAKSMRKIMDKVVEQLEEEVIQKENIEVVNQKLLRYEQIVAKEWIKSIVDGSFNLQHGHFNPSELELWANRSHLVVGIEWAILPSSAFTTISDWNLLRFSVGNVINEVLAKEWPESRYVELQTRKAAIILHRPTGGTEEQFKQQAVKLSEEIQRCMKKYLKLNILVGTGTIKESWKEICESATEAFVSVTAQMAAFHPELNAVQIKFYHHFASAVRNFQTAYARELADEYLLYLREMNVTTETLLQQCTSELWTIMAYSLYDGGLVIDDIYPKTDLQRDLAFITTVDQLRSWLYAKIDLIQERGSNKENMKHKKAIDKLIVYLHEHYMDDITLEGLSEVVEISPNYLCLIFKRVIGETFNQYLTRIRMEKAKEMILEGKWLVYEIAEKVGYKNTPYFSTLFKKVTGYTPTDLVKS